MSVAVRSITRGITQDIHTSISAPDSHGVAYSQQVDVLCIAGQWLARDPVMERVHVKSVTMKPRIVQVVPTHFAVGCGRGQGVRVHHSQILHGRVCQRRREATHGRDMVNTEIQGEGSGATV